MFTSVLFLLLTILDNSYFKNFTILTQKSLILNYASNCVPIKIKLLSFHVLLFKTYQ